MIPYYSENLDAKIRVFISSTFRDMQNERNVVVNSVFPLLRRDYKDRNVDITEVDLRWGITEQEITSMDLLEICIGETLNCIPFFVGLLGDNYGTIAKYDEIRSLPMAYKLAVGIKSREEIPDGVSLTEFEMRAGAFVKNNKEYSRFFIKSSSETNSESLRRLKDKIIADGYDYCTYSSIDDFEEKIYQSIKALVESYLPNNDIAPYRDRHYASHLKLLKKRSYSYVPNEDFIEAIQDKIDNTGTLYLFGRKGMGKTSAMCHLIIKDGITKDGNVFFHFADADSESLDQDNLFHRLRLYIEGVLKASEADMNDYSAILSLLSKADSSMRMTLYFDAVEKYHDNALISKLFALNKINSRVRVVCSGAIDYKKLANAEKMEILPLDKEQIRQISVRSLRNYGKKLDDAHMQRLLENKQCQNPLYLNALLSQLIAYGHHESFEQFFDKLIERHGFDELFTVIIERMQEHFRERGFNHEKIFSALALIVYSNEGVKESELGEILELLPIERSVFLANLELFITENDGLIRFNHDLIAMQVKKMLSECEENYERKTAELFVDYFSKKNNSNGIRAYSEKTFQLDKLDRFSELLDELKSIDCFMYLAKNQFNKLIRYLGELRAEQEEFKKEILPRLCAENTAIAADVFCQASLFDSALMAICRAIGIEADFNPHLDNSPDEIAKRIISSNLPLNTKVRFFAIASRSYYKIASKQYKLAERMYVLGRDFYKASFPDDEVGLATHSYLLGVTYKSMADMETAKDTLRFAFDVFKKHNVKNEVSSWTSSVYGDLLLYLGDIEQAKDAARHAIDDNLFLFGEDSVELAWSYSYAYSIYYMNGEKETAIKIATDAHKIYNTLYHGIGAKVAWSAVNLGVCEHMMGNLSYARELYDLSIEENNALAPKEQRPHIYSLTTYSNVATLLQDEGDDEGAYKFIEISRENAELKHKPNHIYIANILLNEGIIKKNIELIDRAIKIYDLYETPDIFFAKLCKARINAIIGNDIEAEKNIDELYEEYKESDKQADILTYLINETYEKLSFASADADTKSVKERLDRFASYKYYIPLNNGSTIIKIPKI